MTRRIRWALLPALLTAIWLSMMAMGTGPLDRALLLFLYSGNDTAFRSVATFLTIFGEWQFLFPLTLIVGFLLVLTRARKQGLLFLAICLSGRLLVHLQKISIGRIRPEDGEHLVTVTGLSFPSGHSTNSMIVFLAMAIVVAGVRHRTIAIAAAVLVSMAIGVTRPMLGVHWPSDVLGGWSFGAAWVLALVGLSERAPFNRSREDRIEEQPIR